MSANKSKHAESPDNNNSVKIHNDLFQNILKDKQNAIDFLKATFPEDIAKHLNLTDIDYDDTNYVKNDYKNFMSDLVIKTTINDTATDIYILIEHKSEYKSRELF